MDKKREKITVTPGSGNVFADLGFSEPEEELAKARLASRIREIIKARRLTQTAVRLLAAPARPSKKKTRGACRHVTATDWPRHIWQAAEMLPKRNGTRSRGVTEAVRYKGTRSTKNNARASHNQRPRGRVMTAFP
jgi:hypothetical protein